MEGLSITKGKNHPYRCHFVTENPAKTDKSFAGTGILPADD